MSEDTGKAAEEGNGTDGIPAEGELVCKITPWYYRRMGLMTLMLLACACWFLYDGKVGYPKANHKADIHDAFLAGKEGKEWAKAAEEKGWPIEVPAGDEKAAEVRKAYDAARGGEEWGAFSSERKLPDNPDRHPESDVREQFHYAYAFFFLGGLVLLIMLLNMPKKVRADVDGFHTPDGKRVPYKAIFRVDKRKWDNKGLAYAFYKDEGGRQRKAVIDDLKYGGADKILDRVLEVFDGELIERVYVDDDEEDEGETEVKASAEGREDPEDGAPGGGSTQK